MSHPKIKRLTDSEVFLILRGWEPNSYLFEQQLSDCFVLCISLYVKGSVWQEISERSRIYSSPFTHYRGVKDTFLSCVYYNTCASAASFHDIVNKNKVFTIFGIKNKNLYLMSKSRCSIPNESKDARKFLSAMHYLADDLENGVTNRIYHVN